MAPAYKVTYFDLQGLGEPIRFLLSYGGLEFEDNRIPDDKWPALKPKVALYVFEEDEKVKLAKAGPLFNEILPFYSEKLDAQVKKNNGYFVGDRLLLLRVHRFCLVRVDCWVTRSRLVGERNF